MENNNIKQFIEDVIESKEIEPFWKDEIFVSILLSNYSKRFFDIFKNEKSILKTDIHHYLLLKNQNLCRADTVPVRAGNCRGKTARNAV